MRFDQRRFKSWFGLLFVAMAWIFVSYAVTSHALAEEAEEADTSNEDGDGDDASSEEPSQEDSEKTGEASLFDDIMKLNVAPARQAEQEGASSNPTMDDEGATATVPLAEVMNLSRRIAALQQKKGVGALLPVVLGAATYDGEVDGSVLSLRMKLVVTLAGEGLKFVPLVGDDVALVEATADGDPIGVTRRPGYHVWVTNKQGAFTLELSFLVGPKGGRGSIEYAFRSARTPSTGALIRLPSKGLSPRFDGSVMSDVQADGGGTTVRATLAPTTEIRMVGFRNVTANEPVVGRAVAETISLLSVDERTTDLFTVIRYTILRGAMQSFDVELPEGLEVISAEGEGAFHHATERKDGKTLLRGETALPIEGNYELSLRLRMRGEAGKNALSVKLPHCLGVEREHGWLAVEVPGKLRINETSRKDLVAVSVHELPTEARRSAVSPVLKAYRHHERAPRLDLSVERLPEQELDEGAIDAIEATSVLAAEGKLITELRISLRNASRPSLALTLPAQTEVRSVLLRGEPVRPSRDESGRLLLPLDRSGGDGHDDPIALEVVLESNVASLGLFGTVELTLPALDLGAASLRWRMYLPAFNEYGELKARVARQKYAGAASWHKPPHIKRAVRWNDEDEGESHAASSHTPSWSDLISSGTQKVYTRYWVDAGEGVTLRMRFVRGFLLLPFQLAMGALLIAAIAVRPRASAPRRDRVLRAIRLSLMVLSAGMLIWQGPVWWVALAVLAGVVLLSYRRGSMEAMTKAFRRARGGLPARLMGWIRRQHWPRRRVARAVAMATGFVVVSMVLLERIERLSKILIALVGGEV